MIKTNNNTVENLNQRGTSNSNVLLKQTLFKKGKSMAEGIKEMLGEGNSKS